MISTLVHTLQKQCKLYFIVLVQYVYSTHIIHGKLVWQVVLKIGYHYIMPKLSI
jgi:hypothetical protein